MAKALLLLGSCVLALALAGFCNDKRTDCANWARDGECAGDNSKFMAITCPLSCGVCTHLCNDTDVSCGLCTPECKDLNEECSGWGAAGECNENPEFMIRNCPVTCEACKSTCKDMQNDCPGWTADGECYKNPGFMYK